MKIAFFHQRFDPEPEIKGKIFIKKLMRMGVNAKVITSKPYFKTGNLYPNYRSHRFLNFEKIEGVDVYRVPVYYNHSSSKGLRALHYLSLALNTFLAGIFVSRNVDCIYVCGPPVSIGLSGFLASKILRKPVLYDLQDLWPESIKSSNIKINDLIYQLLECWCVYFYKKMSHIVVQSKGIKDILISKGIHEGNVTVINNWCNEEHLYVENNFDESMDSIFTKEKLNIVFAGNIGKAQGLEVMVDVAAKLEEKKLQVQIILIGDGVEVVRLKKLAKLAKLNNLVFIDYVPINKINNYLSKADLLLIHLKKNYLFTKTIPSKTQAYLAAGKPIIACIDGDARELILESKGGFYAESENSESIILAIKIALSISKEELKKIGENGKNYYFTNMSLDIGKNKFYKLFKQIID